VVYSQDLIYLKTQALPIYGKITSVNNNYIQYYPVTDSLVMHQLNSDSIEKLRFTDQTVLILYKDIDLHQNKALFGFKVGIAAPLFGHSNIGYEHYTRNRQSIECTIGFIHAHSQISNYHTEAGIYTRLAYKFGLSQKNARYKNEKQLLKGFYLKPEMVVGSFRSKFEGHSVYGYHNGQMESYYSEAPSNNKLGFNSLMITPGYQFVFATGFTIDLSVSIGYSRNPSTIYNTRKYYYAFWYPDYNAPICFNAGLKVGYLFLKQKRFQFSE
jgi:hypothetical protein